LAFRHNDLDHLSELLAEHRGRHPRCLILTDGVFSMDGDLAPLADLADLAGAAPDDQLFVESLQRGGGFGSVTLSAGQVRTADALLALRVNGADLSLDHGFPARVVVPAIPGVHNTKWVTRITFLVG
nr:aminotransferase class I/II-fold pyridoxal phosphate-dependent enzyme [Actinomycetota bacterium]